MSSRPFLLGLLLGALAATLAFAIPALGSGTGGSPAALRAADGARSEDATGGREAATQPAGRPPEETRETWSPGDAADATPRESDRTAVEGGERLPELYAELRELIATGALLKGLGGPDQLLCLLVDTWIQAGEPSRAVALLSRFPMDESLAHSGIGAIGQLLAKGDRALALHTCLLVARRGFAREELVQLAAELDPARVLEELDSAAAGKDWGPEWPAQRAALLFAAGDTKAGLELADACLRNEQLGELPFWLWQSLVRHAPGEAESRLRARLAGVAEGDKLWLRPVLAKALDGQGKKAEAAAMLRKLIGEEFEDDFVVQSFREVDPAGLRDWLAERVRTDPDARGYALYGDSLLEAKEVTAAVSAWWQSVQLDPSSQAVYRLLEHVPEQAAPRLTRLARDARNDELLGDIADVLWKLGKRQDAQVLWREARDLDREDSEWAMKLARVRAGKDPLE